MSSLDLHHSPPLKSLDETRRERFLVCSWSADYLVFVQLHQVDSFKGMRGHNLLTLLVPDFLSSMNTKWVSVHTYDWYDGFQKNDVYLPVNKSHAAPHTVT